MHGQPEVRNWPRLLLIWLSFLLYGAVVAPVPGVNEPHYLGKAKHFWQPDWCSHDFFLASPNAHTVFYATFGMLTKFYSLEQAAWIGRAIAMLVLAWGWSRCFSCIFLTPWGPLWSAWVYLGLASCGNFSGEWLVGGVEGKVLCYAFLFAAFADVYRHHWLCAATWTGLAISFHPVVGLWGLMAFGSRTVVNLLLNWPRNRSTIPSSADGNSSWLPRDPKTVLLASLILILLSLPGLIPVAQLLGEPASDDTRYAATYLQVYVRLAHHMDPMMFSSRAYFGYAALVTIWIASFRWGGRTNAQTSFDKFVACSLLFAFVGLLSGVGPRPPKLMPYFAERMNLLKFYPFRLADLLLPVAVSMSLVCVLERSLLNVSSTRDEPRQTNWSPLCMLLIYLGSLGRAHSIAETNRYSREDRADWLDVCQWINANLPRDALVQTPTNGWAFKWFAQRAEYVSFKDCPQDASGMVEWNRRLRFLQHWYERHYSDKFYSAAELRDLQKQTGITHLLVDHLGPMEIQPIYRNRTFQVYDLGAPDADDSKAAISPQINADEHR